MHEGPRYGCTKFSGLTGSSGDIDLTKYGFGSTDEFSQYVSQGDIVITSVSTTSITWEGTMSPGLAVGEIVVEFWRPLKQGN